MFWTAAFLSTFMMSGVAVAEQPRPTPNQGSFEVILDFKNHLALIPEGTILPAGTPPISGRFSIAKAPARRTAFGSRMEREGPVPHFISTNDRSSQDLRPFVFAYAPDKAFAKFRENVQRLGRPVQPNTGCTYHWTYYADATYGCPSCYLTLYVDTGFDDCYSYDYTETYSANAVSSASYFRTVGISSTDGYWSCSNWEEYSSADLGCSTSDTRHYSQTQTTNVTVDAFAEYYDGTNFYDLETCAGCNGGYGYFLDFSYHRNP